MANANQKLISLENLQAYHENLQNYILGIGGGNEDGASAGFEAELTNIDWNTINSGVIVDKNHYYFKVCSYSREHRHMNMDLYFRICVNGEYTRVACNVQYPHGSDMRAQLIPERIFFESDNAKGTVVNWRLKQMTTSDANVRELWMVVEAAENYSVSEAYVFGLVRAGDITDTTLEAKPYNEYSFTGDSLNLTMENFANKTTIGNISSHAAGEYSAVFGSKSYTGENARGAFAGGLPLDESSLAQEIATRVEATGAASFAYGKKARASGTASVALGYDCAASAQGAVALTENVIASGRASLAAGYGAKTLSEAAMALGSNVVAGVESGTATGATALGRFTKSTATGSFAAGLGQSTSYPTLASADAAVAMGFLTQATEKGAVAMGQGGYNSSATDNAKKYRIITASGEGAIAMGYHGDGKDYLLAASGKGAIALGHGTVAAAEGAVGVGHSSQSKGIGAFAAGYYAKATKQGAVAIGYDISSAYKNGVAIGPGACTGKEGQIVFGPYNNSDTTSILVVGNGKGDKSRSNVFTIGPDGTRSDVSTDGVTIEYADKTFVSYEDVNNGYFDEFYKLSAKWGEFDGFGYSAPLPELEAGQEYFINGTPFIAVQASNDDEIWNYIAPPIDTQFSFNGFTFRVLGHDPSGWRLASDCDPNFILTVTISKKIDFVTNNHIKEVVWEQPDVYFGAFPLSVDGNSCNLISGHTYYINGTKFTAVQGSNEYKNWDYVAPPVGTTFYFAGQQYSVGSHEPSGWHINGPEGTTASIQITKKNEIATKEYIKNYIETAILNGEW